MDIADDVAEITRIESSRARAIVAADIVTLDRITDDDYVHVEVSGKARDKRSFLDGVAPDGGGRFARYELQDNLVRIFGDAAVVIGTFQNTFLTADGVRIHKRARHTRVYIRREAGWKNVSHHATAIP